MASVVEGDRWETHHTRTGRTNERTHDHDRFKRKGDDGHIDTRIGERTNDESPRGVHRVSLATARGCLANQLVDTRCAACLGPRVPLSLSLALAPRLARSTPLPTPIASSTSLLSTRKPSASRAPYRRDVTDRPAPEATLFPGPCACRDRRHFPSFGEEMQPSSAGTESLLPLALVHLIDSMPSSP